MPDIPSSCPETSVSATPCYSQETEVQTTERPDGLDPWTLDWLEIEDIEIPEGRARPLSSHHRIELLAESIARDGLFHPITVSRSGRLLAGRNRLAAMEMLGWKKIPVRVVTAEGLEAELVELRENLRREDLTAGQRARMEARDAEIKQELGEMYGHGGDRRSKQDQSPTVGLWSADAVDMEDQVATFPKRKTAAAVAAEQGIKRSTFFLHRSIANRICPDAWAMIDEISLEDNDLPNSTRQLEWLSKQKVDVQVEVVHRVATGPRNMTVWDADRERKQEAREQRTREAEEVDATVAKEIAAEVRSGEWWRLGAHLLYCGDSSSEAFVTAVPQVAFAFADPPYNAAVAEWDSDFKWRHDWLIDRASVVAVTPGIASLFQFARETKMPYLWSFAAWIDNGMARSPLGFGNWIYVSLFSHQSIHRKAQDFMRLSVSVGETDDTEHKGRKPAALVSRLVELFSGEGETLVDPFLGSGTTLLVCQRRGRRCIGADLRPEACTEIVARWEQMTGLTAERVSYAHSVRAEQRRLFVAGA